MKRAALLLVTLLSASAGAGAVEAPGKDSLPAPQAPDAVVAEAPATITVTTGGGNRINDRVVALFAKTRWMFRYPDDPELEREVNRRLEADGYDVEKGPLPNGWWVDTVILGDPERYQPPGDGNEVMKANVERVGRVVGGALLSLFSLGRIDGGRIAGGDTAANPYAKYITQEMVAGLPPGVKKMLLTRIRNPRYKAQQEVLTVSYSEISDHELRRINAGPLLEMIGIQLTSTKGEDNHAENGPAAAGGIADAGGLRQ